MSPEPALRSAPFTPFHIARGEAASVAAGYSSGYTAGWSAGSRAAAEEADEQRRRVAEESSARAQQAAAAAQQALGALARAADAARNRSAPVLADSAEQLTRAAVTLAEAVLGAELRDDDAAAQAALRRALQVRDEGIVRIRMHPDDVAHLTATFAALPGDLRVPDDVELVADARLARGDAVSELEEGYLDARVSTAVERARAALGVDS